MLITGKHFGPFWFIPMISLVYLLAVPLLYLDRSSWFYKYVFPVIFLAGFFLYRFGYNSSIFESLFYFLPIYIFGMWASRYHEKIVENRNILLPILLAIYIIISFLEVSDVFAIGKTYGFDEELKSNAYLFNFGKLKATALSVIILLVLHGLQSITARLWGVFASYSFGVFFLHLYVIRSLELIIEKLGINITFNSLIYLVHVVLIIVICLVIIRVIKLFLGRNSRFVIGC